MPSKRPTGTRNETIRCEFCGEDYAATYKRCPFCDGRPPDEEDANGVRKPKREVYNTRGGGYGGGPSPAKIIGTILSLALIIAAVVIVVSIIKPLVDKGDPTLDATPSPSFSAQPTPSGTVQPSTDPSPGETAGTGVLSPGPNATPAPNTSKPAGQTATGFTLSKEDVTLSEYGESFTLRATLIPAGSSGTVTFESSNPAVASVDANGVVKGLSRGRVEITATLPGGGTKTCIVRCGFDAPAGSGSASGSEGSSSETVTNGSLSLNRTDFTLEKQGQTFQMKVSGTSSTPTWSIGNTSVAKISSDGTVTAVAKGNTTITCTVDGQTLTCIVRCSF